MGKSTALLESEYKKSVRFRQYVDRYCRVHNITGITVEEALRHEVVRQVYSEYKEENKDENIHIGWESICGT